MIRVFLAAVVIAFLPSVASAHTTGPGGRAFLSGFLHPYLIPQHLLILIGLAILLAQRQRAASKGNLPVVLPGLVAGLAVTCFSPCLSIKPVVLISCAAVIGLLVVLARPLPRWIDAALTMAVVFLVGLDSAQESAKTYEVVAALLGVIVSIHLFLIDVAYCLNVYRPA